MFALVFPVQKTHCRDGGSSTSFFTSPSATLLSLSPTPTRSQPGAELTVRENKFAATYRAFQASSVRLQWRLRVSCSGAVRSRTWRSLEVTMILSVPHIHPPDPVKNVLYEEAPDLREEHRRLLRGPPDVIQDEF